MGRRQSGLFLTLKRLSDGNWKEKCATLARDVWLAVGLPVVTTLVVVFTLLYLHLYIRRHYFMTAPELHREALLLYQQQCLPKSEKTFRRFYRNVHNLLERAVTRDPSYERAYLSLAALYLYPPPTHSHHGRDIAAALRVLQQCPATQAETVASIRAMQLDAEAIQTGQFHMVQDMLMQNEYLSRSFVKNDNGRNEERGEANFRLRQTHNLTRSEKESNLLESKKIR